MLKKIFFIFIISITSAHCFESSGDFKASMNIDLFKESQLFEKEQRDLFSWHGKMSFNLENFGAYCKFTTILADTILQEINSDRIKAYIPVGAKYSIKEIESSKDDAQYEVSFEEFVFITKEDNQIKMPMMFRSRCIAPLNGFLHPLQENFIETNLQSGIKLEVDDTQRSLYKTRRDVQRERKNASAGESK